MRFVSRPQRLAAWDRAIQEARMAVDDVRQRVRSKLEELLGPEEASWLMDRPPGGWSDLVTNRTLDLKIDALRSELRSDFAALRSDLTQEISRLDGSVDRRLRAQTWITTTTLLAGLGLAFTAGRIG
jgi:hypothetical protein